MAIETGNFFSKDGTKLFYRAASSGGTPVVITHGFAEHSGRYEEVMSELSSAGYAPLAFDLRGHGHSEGKRGFIRYFEEYVDDLKAAAELAQKKYESKSVIALAHSMGGLVASHYALSDPGRVKGLVISSPLFGIRVHVPAWKKQLGRVMAKCWPAFSMPNNIDAANLTHDEAKAEIYRRDPLIFHHVCAGWFEEIQASTEKSLETAAKFEKPFLLQLSEDDRIVSYERSCQWYERNTSVDKSLRVYSGFFHEIYNERDRKKPIQDFLAWMLERWPQGEKRRSEKTSSSSSSHNDGAIL